MAKKTETEVEQVRAARDAAREQGYEGVTPDETPNADYSVAGVTKGASTADPEDKTTRRS